MPPKTPKKKKKKHYKITSELANELFALVEINQVHGFISDGMDAMKRERFWAAVRIATVHTVLAGKKMQKFLKDNSQDYAARARRAKTK